MSNGLIYKVKILNRGYFTLFGMNVHAPVVIDSLSDTDLAYLNTMGWSYTILTEEYPQGFDPSTLVDTFLELTDTPAAYTGHGGKGLRVKSSVDGVEFYTIDAGTNDHAAIDSHISSTSNPHSVTHAQLIDAGTISHANLDLHVGNTSNPHSVTAEQVGVADEDERFTGATVEAVLAEIDAAHDTLGSTVTSHVGNSTNPHSVTAGQVNILDSGELYTATTVEAALAEVMTEVAGVHVFTNESLLDTYTQSDVNLTDAVSKKHSQNTDTGTTSQTFTIYSGAGADSIILNNNSGDLEILDGNSQPASISVYNLTVTGTTTTVNSVTVNIADNILTLNSGVTGTPTLNSGLEVERGIETNASFIWDESADLFKAGLAGAEVAISLSGHSHAAVDVTDFDTEVGNHADVTANTAARHSHTNSAALDSITAAGSGSIITTEERNKLSGIAEAAEVNQYAFSIIAVSGEDNVEAEAKTDTLTLSAGTGVSITTNATSDTVTITATDLGSSAVTTHESTYNHSTFITSSAVTYENLSSNGDIGTTSNTLAAGDDSRFHEHSNKAVLDQVEASLRKITFTSPDLGTAVYVHPAITLADGSTTEVTTEIVNPDLPRVLTITGNAVGIAGNVVIVGTNAVDEALTETIVANGTDTVIGTKAFKTVTSITVPARNAESDAISVGVGDKLGVGRVVTTGLPLIATAAGVTETTLPVFTKDVTMALNLIDFDSVLDGSKTFVCYYIEG